METTSETVWKEKSNLISSSIIKKCVQEVSASAIEKLSCTSSSLEDEGKIYSVVLTSDDRFGNQLASDNINIIYPGTIVLTQQPSVTSSQPPDDGYGEDSTSLKNEFVTMAINDEHDSEIRQFMQSLSSVSTATSNTDTNTSTLSSQLSTANSSSKVQQTSSARSLVAESQEASSSSTSLSCCSFSSVKKQEIVSSSTSSLSSMKSSQSIERVVKSSIAVVKD